MILELANGLSLNKFGVMGHSGGGPFSLACGYKLPERLTCISMVCGAGPPLPELMVGMSKQMSEFYAFAIKYPEKYSEIFLSSMGSHSFDDRLQEAKNNWIEPDREILSPANIEMWRKSDFETFRQGPGGALKHFLGNLQPYEFEIQQIKVPTFIWQGELDDVIPPAMAKYMARSIPGSELHLIPGEGHNSLIVNHAEAILSTMYTKL